MGLSSRSVSLFRYQVQGSIEGPFWEVVDLGIRKGAFQNRDSSSDEMGSGWVSMDDFTDNEFKGASCVHGNYVALALRIDSVRIPARVLEMHLKKESKKLLEETDKQVLSSSQRMTLKDYVKESLRRHVFPSIQVFDLVWDTTKALVYFFSQSNKARERMEELFKKSFGLSLIPLIPYLKAQQLLSNHSDRQLLEKLKASSIIM